MAPALHARTVLCPVALVMVAVLSGCRVPEPEEAVPPGFEMPQPVGTEPAESARPAARSFEWSGQPTVDDIPAGPVEGVIAGIPMTSPRIEIAAEGDGRYRLKFVATRWAYPEEQQPRAADQVASAALSFTLAQGERGPLQWSLDDSPRDAAASFACAPHPSQYTIYANRRWAAAVEITRWEGGLPTAGRVALCFDDIGASWVAGEFEARPPDR